MRVTSYPNAAASLVDCSYEGYGNRFVNDLKRLSALLLTSPGISKMGSAITDSTVLGTKVVLGVQAAAVGTRMLGWYSMSA